MNFCQDWLVSVFKFCCHLSSLPMNNYGFINLDLLHTSYSVSPKLSSFESLHKVQLAANRALNMLFPDSQSSIVCFSRVKIEFKVCLFSSTFRLMSARISSSTSPAVFDSILLDPDVIKEKFPPIFRSGCQSPADTLHIQ